MVDKRETHLAMIQGIVNRLSQNSFLLKGWNVLLVSALLALAANSSEESILYVAFLPAVAFWVSTATSSGKSACSGCYTTVPEKSTRTTSTTGWTPVRFGLLPYGGKLSFLARSGYSTAQSF